MNSRLNIDSKVIDELEQKLMTHHLGKVNRDHIKFLCPIHEDTNPSASYEIEKMVWNCFACDGGGGFFDLCDTIGVKYTKFSSKGPTTNEVVIPSCDESHSMDMSDDELKKLRDESLKVYYKSSFGFLNSHNCIRPGCIHLVIAPKGSGKSVFCRTLSKDIAVNNPNASLLIILSEESKEQFKTQFSFAGFPKTKYVKLFSKLDEDIPDKNFTSWLKVVCNEHMADIVIIDNITTLPEYESCKPSEQTKMANQIKKIGSELKTAMFVIAHTGGHISESKTGLIDENDIRGSKGFSNIAEFLYIIQPVRTKKHFLQYLRIRNARGQEIMHDLYSLKYCFKTKLFINDNPVDFEAFKTFYKQRIKL